MIIIFVVYGLVNKVVVSKIGNPGIKNQTSLIMPLDAVSIMNVLIHRI